MEDTGKEVLTMAEGICYVCNKSFKAADRSTAIDKIVRHLMTVHLGLVKSDTLDSKNKFATCPVCGAGIGKPLLKCPHCGTDLMEQFARKMTSGHVKES
jgi:hypothetical protein